MSIAGWQHRLDEASTPEDVVDVVHDFLALWKQEDIEELPFDCRPGGMASAAQVNSYALKLARRHTIGIGDVSAMHRMATFFTKAALRLYQINEEGFSDVPRERREGGRADT
jgi:hypothetical protein